MKTCLIFCYITSLKGFKNVTVVYEKNTKHSLSHLYDIVSAKLSFNNEKVSVSDILSGNSQKEIDELIDKSVHSDYRKYLESLRTGKIQENGNDQAGDQCSAKKRAARIKARKKRAQVIPLQ